MKRSVRSEGSSGDKEGSGRRGNEGEWWEKEKRGSKRQEE